MKTCLVGNVKGSLGQNVSVHAEEFTFLFVQVICLWSSADGSRPTVYGMAYIPKKNWVRYRTYLSNKL